MLTVRGSLRKIPIGECMNYSIILRILEQSAYYAPDERGLTGPIETEL